jgi:hypothetical protein
MKIGKAAIVVLFLGIIAIGAGLLFMLWQDENDRGNQLTANLDTARALLPTVNNGVTDAEADLAVAQDGLTAAQASLSAAQASLDEFIDRFPEPPPLAAIQTIDYGVQMFILAANNSLNLTEFHASDFTAVTIDNIQYQRTTLSFKVIGSMLNINNFVGNLETSDPYLTATIDSVSTQISNEYDAEIAGVPLPESFISITVWALEG